MNDMITITKEEYDRLIDAADDLADIQAVERHLANPEESVSSEFVDRMLDGESILLLWRDKRGLTQSALSDASGVGRGLIAQIETGRKTGSVATLKKLATALGVDLDDLV